MKKVIDGKRYDTTTAKHMATGYSDYPVSDFNYWEEELYRKRTGEFFLYGKGGPASKYSKSLGMNSWTGGSKIIPLTVAAAKKWAEQHLDADEYEEIFTIESEEKIVQTASIPEALAAEIKTRAKEENKTISAVIEEALIKYLAE